MSAVNPIPGYVSSSNIIALSGLVGLTGARVLNNCFWDEESQDYITPLMHALKKTDERFIDELLKLGADVNVRSRQGRSVIHFLCWYSLPFEVFKRLALKFEGAIGPLSPSSLYVADEVGETPIEKLISLQDGDLENYIFHMLFLIGKVVSVKAEPVPTFLPFVLECNNPLFLFVYLQAGIDASRHKVFTEFCLTTIPFFIGDEFSAESLFLLLDSIKKLQAHKGKISSREHPELFTSYVGEIPDIEVCFLKLISYFLSPLYEFTRENGMAFKVEQFNEIVSRVEKSLAPVGSATAFSAVFEEEASSHVGMSGAGADNAGETIFSNS